ncbi:MAG: DUF1553 domain-containing protein, partial [Cyanobium sp.]
RRRSMPDPALGNFDAPTGDLSCARRLRSNTPLAALTGLNEPVFVEAARALAVRALQEGGGDDASRIERAFLLCTSRGPTPEEKREKVSIIGIDQPTINSYMDLLNANDFDALIALFLEDGALQPPFQKPIVGHDAILRFFREDCQNLKLLPERGVSEPSDGGFTQIKVTGSVQTPWFGAGVGMNVAWRFLLDPQGKIYFVAIDLLASAADLLAFAR